MPEEFPKPDMALTHILVVNDFEKSKDFYKNILGAELFREYPGSAVFKFLNSWILLVTSGGPTEDKPNVFFKPPTNPDDVSHAMTIRVPNCQESYEILKSRGAKFLTPPVDHGQEVRCFFRDPSGHLLEISEAK